MAEQFTIPAGWEEVTPTFQIPDGWEVDEKATAQDAKLRNLTAQANVPRSDEWWAKRRNEAAMADADPVSRMPAIIREPVRGFAGAGANIAGTIARPFSKDAADFIAREKEQINSDSEALRNQDWSPWLSRMYGGAAESLAQGAAAAPLGPVGVIGSFALTEGNQALYDAEQAGLTGADRIKYAVVQGAIEGAVAGVFQKFAPGLEGMIPGIASGAMKTSGKQLLRATAQELPEELLTELGHAITEANYGIDPNAMSREQIGQRMVDTIAQTVLTMGLAGGAAKATESAGRLMNRLDNLREIRDKGFVTAQEAEQLGMTPEESGSRAKRMAAVKQRIQDTQKELQRESQVQRDEVRQGEDGRQGQGRPEGQATETAPARPTEVPVERPPPLPPREAPPAPRDVTPQGQSEPPVPEGKTRLYHGSGEHGRYTGPAWYSTNRDYAANYREGGELQYVDVPTDWANQQADPDGLGQTPDRGFTLNTEIKNDEFGPRRPIAQPEPQSSPAPQETAPPAPVEETAPPPIDEARVSELLKRRGKLGNKAAEAKVRQEVAEEAQALQQYPAGTRLEIEGYQSPFEVKPDGTLVENGTNRQMGDNAGAVLRQYKPEQITVIASQEAPTTPQNAPEAQQAPEVVQPVATQQEAAQEPVAAKKRVGRKSSLPDPTLTGQSLGEEPFPKRTKPTASADRELVAATPAKRVRKPKLPIVPEKQEQPDEFGREVSDVLGIAGGAPISTEKGTAGRSVQHFFQRFFTSRGELPQEVYDAKVRKEGRVSKEMAHLRFTAEDFRKGIHTALDGKELTQANVEKMNAVLRGEADESSVPDQVRAPLRAMRDHIDSLSRSLIAEGVAQGDLVGTITENMGVYATRSYRVFDDPKWRDKVPAPVRNRAIAAIRQMNPGKSDAEVQGLLESLLFRGAADSPVALLKGSKLGSKDLSTFMKRQDIPEWLRDLWGEYKDAGVNYARSVFKMSHLLANQQFLNRVREAGTGKWLRTQEDGPVVNKYGDVITQIAAEGSSTMEPLNGMYTTPEIKAAFERLDSPGALPQWLRVLMAVNSAVKYSKTVGSMMTHIRNLISNTGFAVANGHWRVDKAGKALWGTATGMFSRPDAEFRAYYERAAELGLVGEDVRAGELKDALRDASRANIDEFLYNAQERQAKKIVRSGRKAVRFVESLYQAEDAVWKLYAWENEKSRYAKAHPEWSDERVEKHAAEIVRDTYPTYSKTPEAIKGLRRFPLVGTFVSFPSEVVRTTFQTIKRGLAEMQAPETRSIGAQRLAGTVVSLGALSVLSQAMMALFGIGDEEDDDLRWFVPPWQENSRFIYTAKPENGTYRFVDLGYSDPHAYITDAAVAFMRGDDWQDGLLKAMGEFLSPFATEEILAKTLMDVRGNEGQDIYNPKDEAGQQAADIIAYVWKKALEPGTIASLRRIKTAIEGTDPSLEADTEVLALTTGQRLQKVDVEHSLGFRVREFSQSLTDIQSIARDTATSRGTATGGMVATDRARMEALRVAEFAQMQRILGAARRLGVSEENIRALVTGELPDDVAQQVLSGDYAPYEMTTQTVRQMLEANPQEFSERFSAWFGDDAHDAAKKIMAPVIGGLPVNRPTDTDKAAEYDTKWSETGDLLKSLGVTKEEAAELLREHYLEDGRMTKAERKGYNAKLAALRKLYD